MDESHTEDKPPPSEQYREQVQLPHSIRLLGGVKHGGSIRGGELAFVCHSAGAKPMSGHYYSTGISEDDEAHS